MKRFGIDNVLSQRKPKTHILIILFSALVVMLSVIMSPGPASAERFISVFILIFVQIEFFLLLAHFIFRSLEPGVTRGEITRSVLSRFALFMIACFMSAFVIMILFRYGVRLLSGNNFRGVIPEFFRYEFSGWFKTTIMGLTFGAVIFIIVLWQDALKREQKLREENLIFQNETLRNQVNPHFLFNSLNTLSSLISTKPDIAEKFIIRLSSIYRYILDNSQKDIIALSSELAFISDYFDLHKVRDEEKINLRIDLTDTESFHIIPVSLQILVENAVKHNMATRENPLEIEVYIENQHIVVKNSLQRMSSALKSTRIGLKNLNERLKLITGKELIIEELDKYFIVKVPLIK